MNISKQPERYSTMLRTPNQHLPTSLQCFLLRILLVTIITYLPMQGLAAASALAREPDTYYREYEIKAGFIYRFISFVSWPEAEDPATAQTLTIGIVGPNPFGDALKPIEGRSVDGRTIQIMYFKGDLDYDKIKACQMLFVSQQDEGTLQKLLHNLAGSPVLTIGDTPGFIDKGGMVGFFTHERQQIGIEINAAAANRAGLTFRSMLMRIAARIIDKPGAEYRRLQDGQDMRLFQMICSLFPKQHQLSVQWVVSSHGNS